MTFCLLPSAVPWRLSVPWPIAMTVPFNSVHRPNGGDLVKQNFLVVVKCLCQFWGLKCKHITITPWQFHPTSHTKCVYILNTFKGEELPCWADLGLACLARPSRHGGPGKPGHMVGKAWALVFIWKRENTFQVLPRQSKYQLYFIGYNHDLLDPALKLVMVW